MGSTNATVGDTTNENVEFWREYSCQNHPYSEIREKAIRDAKIESTEISHRRKIYGCECAALSYSYLSQFQVFTEEQIEEMMVITSPFFPVMEFDLSNRQCVDTVLRILSIGYDREKQREEISKILREDSQKNIDEALPSNFRLFLEKAVAKTTGIPTTGFQDKLDWRNIKKFQNLSPEFCIKWDSVMTEREATPHMKNHTVTYSKSVLKGKSNKSRQCKKY